MAGLITTSAGRGVLAWEVRGLARILSEGLFLSSWGLRVFRACPEMSLCQSLISAFLARGHGSTPAPGGVDGSRAEDV